MGPAAPLDRADDLSRIAARGAHCMCTCPPAMMSASTLATGARVSSSGVDGSRISLNDAGEPCIARSARPSPRSSRAKRTDLLDAVGPEHRLRPACDLELLLRRRLDAPVEVDHESIGVPENDRAAERGQAIEALLRLRPALEGVAEADVVVDGAIGRVCQERLEPDEVAVDVRENGCPQSASRGARGTRVGPSVSARRPVSRPGRRRRRSFGP